MTDATHAPHAAEAHAEHGVGKYIAVFIALCVLTTASFFTYSDYWPYKETPAIGWTFMMMVSCSKAALVLLFFMHLKYEADWKYVLTIPASIMSLFLALALVPDIGLRLSHYSMEREQYMGTKAITEQLEEASLADVHKGASHVPEKH